MSKSTNILYCMSFMTVHGLLQERCPDYMFSYFPTGPVKQLFSIKLPLFSYPSIEYVLDLICFGCSKEPSQKDCSFEYTQHMFWLRNNKNNFHLHTLIWAPHQIFICGNMEFLANFCLKEASRITPV